MECIINNKNRNLSSERIMGLVFSSNIDRKTQDIINQKIEEILKSFTTELTKVLISSISFNSFNVLFIGLYHRSRESHEKRD